MDEHLKTIAKIIDEYESGTYLTMDRLLELLRQLSGAMYHLTVINTQSAVRYNSIQYNFSGSVAKGIVNAEQEVPELRMTRKILDACNKVHSSIIMELSILKKESE